MNTDLAKYRENAPQNFLAILYLDTIHYFNIIVNMVIIRYTGHATVTESADETDLKSVGSNLVWVQIPPVAPTASFICASLLSND